MEQERDLILTCDAGTTGLKCSLFNTQGEAVRTVRRAYGTEYPHHNWAQQDCDVILENVYSGIRELLEQVSARRVACVGLSGHMNGCLPVDADGRALMPNIIHADSRSEKQVEKIASVISPEDFYRLTGNRLDVHYSLPKMLWVKENLPDVYRRTRWWLNTKDYIYGHLTGHFGQTDFSDASLTIAMDIGRGQWAEELLQSLGLAPEQMPRILPGHDVRGRTTRDVYRKTGLIAGTPVAIGGGDGACTGRGAGLCEEGSSYTYIGSSAWVSQMTSRPVLDPQMRIFNFLDMDGKRCHVLGTVQCGAAAFDWARANLFGGAGDKDVLDISRDSCGGIWSTFFRAFRENFKQATIVWLITLLIAASLICDFMLIRFFIQGPLYTVLFVIICILACTVAAVLLYLYPLMIRYQNTLREHLHNAMILTIYQFPRTLAMLFFHALPLLMALFLSSLFLYTLLFWLALGFSMVPMMDVYLLRPVFQKLDDMAHTTAC